MQTYYEILGVDSKAPEKEIKSAFRALARKHHPDVKGDPAKFREIYEAYEVLVDSQKRAEYDRLGPEVYVREGRQSTETTYPSYEEIFREEVRRRTSTETPYDFLVGRLYPSIYIGQEVEDPFTEDIYSSAEDIKIAKMERAWTFFNESMNKVKNSVFFGHQGQTEALRELMGIMFNEGHIDEEEFDEDMKLIDVYEIKDREYRKERDMTEHAQEIGDPVQEKIERQEAKSESEIKTIISEHRQDRTFLRGKRLKKGRRGLAEGEDPDKRKKWRQETSEGRSLR